MIIGIRWSAFKEQAGLAVMKRVSFIQHGRDIAVRFLSVIAFVLGVLFHFAPQAQAVPPVFDKPVVSLAAFNYPPFYYQTENGVTGIAVDIIHELFERMEMEVEIDMFPLRRALQHLKGGSKDGIMILIKNPSRQEYIDYTDPVMTVRGLLWSAADRPDGRINFEQLSELRRYKIGVTRGYSYGTSFDKLLERMDVETANSDLINFRKLLAHRLDVFPCNEIVAKGLFKLHPDIAGKAVPSEDAFIEWILHMGISKKSSLRNWIPELNRILRELKDEGFIGRAIGKYTQ